MPIQLSFTDKFKHDNPQAYMVLSEGRWKRGSGGFQITGAIYASKQAMDSGGAPVHEFDQFVPFDSSSMTSGIEQYFMTLPDIAAGTPTQVA